MNSGNLIFAVIFALTIAYVVVKSEETDNANDIRLYRVEREARKNKKREGRKKIAIAAVEKIVAQTLTKQLDPLNTAFQLIRLDTFSQSVVRQLTSLENIQSKILTEYGELRATISEVGRHTMELGRQVAGLDERLTNLDRHLPHRLDVTNARNDYRKEPTSPTPDVHHIADSVKDALFSITSKLAQAVEVRMKEDLLAMESRMNDSLVSIQNNLGRRLSSVALDTEKILNNIDKVTNKTTCSVTNYRPTTSSYYRKSLKSSPVQQESPQPTKITSHIRDDLVYLPAEERIGNFDHLEREERQHPPSITPFQSGSVAWPRPEIQNFNFGSVQNLANEISKRIRVNEGITQPKDCQDVATYGERRSGIYTIYPASCTKRFAVKIWCELVDVGGGWSVIQSRGAWKQTTTSSSPFAELPNNPSSKTRVDFFKDWLDYKWGFGDLDGEYWLGNEYIYQITQSGDYELRIEIEDWTQETRWAEYQHFVIGSEEQNYTLYIGDYEGNAGNSLKHHQGASFSTKDRDNDSNPRGHCARTFHGAWWFTSCHESHLNGRYHIGRHKSYSDGIIWRGFKGHNYSLKKSRMMIRPARAKT